MIAKAGNGSIKESHLAYYVFEKKGMVVIWYCKDLREILFTTDVVSIPDTKYCGIQWMILLFYRVMEVP